MGGGVTSDDGRDCWRLIEAKPLLFGPFPLSRQSHSLHRVALPICCSCMFAFLLISSLRLAGPGMRPVAGSICRHQQAAPNYRRNVPNYGAENPP